MCLAVLQRASPRISFLVNVGAGYVTNQSTTLVIGSLTSLSLSLSLNIETCVSSPFSFSSPFVLCPTFANIYIYIYPSSLSTTSPRQTILQKRRETEEEYPFPSLNHPWLHFEFPPTTPTLLSSSTRLEPPIRGFSDPESLAVRENGSMEEEEEDSVTGP